MKEEADRVMKLMKMSLCQNQLIEVLHLSSLWSRRRLKASCESVAHLLRARRALIMPPFFSAAALIR